MAHPLDDPIPGDRWLFTMKRPDGSDFKRLFLVCEDEQGSLILFADYVMMGLLADFPFDTGIWARGKWQRNPHPKRSEPTLREKYLREAARD